MFAACGQLATFFRDVVNLVSLAVAIATFTTSKVCAEDAPRGSAAIAAERKLSISSAGRALEKYLDSLNVEKFWLHGHDRVDWKTGRPIVDQAGQLTAPLQDDETHCSTFAAAAADRLGIYLLHPPEHSHVLLSDAQFDWLPNPKGHAAGWKPVPDAVSAQQQANSGKFVVAVFKNPLEGQPGHIAVVRPAPVSKDRVLARGPQITQAGATNYRNGVLDQGFSHHPGAWLPNDKGGVRFYSHNVAPDKLGGQ